ncbi:TPA: phosphohydrolase [candidate division CPR2 bacterium]|uniref:Metal dependent phosphohydrolase n=1 Tax=candidate division CPR2 bacterium GW2011_GWC1_41_48 TaxID=1618344 RepID=A0A0G0ZA15_UNCC2|nr:MAG: Metal dependent phosphohydrolase [candidate division CPR2 bacterium GW2011_GWC2_39_35]KKR28850.1 MAG: Metal dependent phosphohydrolase [candidate division CPR2 bacterium GW2011_GWD2_39_7]KKS09893.1 MAG: Metal dependent phosphohydrolase [candidate division CPR2 bacterium GW2011_GWC1_41_48]OGB73193.1 MAG: hypothetical protein A2Y26_01215 [candidate division CPR2 bacterium GWD2_39_7]HBG81687.1 phosphohydrolase [candidate division CPR2 bacterium]
MAYNRQNYLQVLKEQLEPNILNHSLAVEACMGGLYDYFESNGLLDTNEPPREDWLLAGLLHDIDYAGEFKDEHPYKTKEALEKYGLGAPEAVISIIKAHAARYTNEPLDSKADWSIFCCDSLTGLIVAVALILPSKKLEDVKLSSVTKRFLKQPSFAAGTRRDEVAMCQNPEGLNMPLEKFIEICLNSMKGIVEEVGL